MANAPGYSKCLLSYFVSIWDGFLISSLRLLTTHEKQKNLIIYETYYIIKSRFCCTFLKQEVNSRIFVHAGNTICARINYPLKLLLCIIHIISFRYFQYLISAIININTSAFRAILLRARK